MTMPLCPCPTPPRTDVMTLPVHCVITTDAECETPSFRTPAGGIPPRGTGDTARGYRPGKRFLDTARDTGPRLSAPPLVKIFSRMRPYAGLSWGVSGFLQENTRKCGGLRAEFE